MSVSPEQNRPGLRITPEPLVSGKHNMLIPEDLARAIGRSIRGEAPETHPRVMRVYFAGAAQHSWLEGMRGRHVLESFANIRRVTDRYRATWASGMLDSGAFTEMTTGVPIDLQAYRDFAVRHGDFYESIANLDDIRGDVDKSKRNLQYLKDGGVDAFPVFHQGEPMSVLDDYCAESPMIGLGFQRPIKNAQRWLDLCFARIPTITKVHGFAMTSYMHSWPFSQVDSTSWLWEVKGLMSVKGQGSDALKLLTQSELLDIVLKKYDRLPKASKWRGMDL